MVGWGEVFGWKNSTLTQEQYAKDVTCQAESPHPLVCSAACNDKQISVPHLERVEACQLGIPHSVTCAGVELGHGFTGWSALY